MQVLGLLAGPLNGYLLEHHAGWAALLVLVGIETVVSAAAWLFIDCRKPLEPAPGSYVRASV